MERGGKGIAALLPLQVQFRIRVKGLQFKQSCVQMHYMSSFLANVNVLAFTFAICYRPSICRLSVTLVRPTQAVQIFRNISTAFGTLAIF